jgi:tetratricopeptide (TPR) repeat protein
MVFNRQRAAFRLSLRVRRRLQTGLIFGIFSIFSGCSSVEKNTSATTAPPAESLFEKRLRTVVEKEERLWRDLEQRQARGEALTDANVRPRFEELAGDYSSILMDNPDEVLPLVLYGKLLRRLGEREHAHTLFMRANSLDPSLPVVKQQLGNYYAEEERPGVALALYLEAIALAPEEAVYYYGLGELLHTFRDDFLAEPEAFNRDKIDRQMLEAFRSAADLAPENRDFQMRYGEAFLDIEKPDWPTALAHWEKFQLKAHEGAEADAVRLHRAHVLVALNRPEEARSLAENVQTPALLVTKEQILKKTGSL